MLLPKSDNTRLSKDISYCNMITGAFFPKGLAFMITPIVLDILFDIYRICSFQLTCSSRITPQNFVFDTCSIF